MTGQVPSPAEEGAPVNHRRESWLGRTAGRNVVGGRRICVPVFTQDISGDSEIVNSECNENKSNRAT
jgi:hypothetical protein